MKSAKVNNFRFMVTIGCFVQCFFTSGCPTVPTGDIINPFRDVPPIELDGLPHEITSTLTPIGAFVVGDVISINVAGLNIDAVLILKEDDQNVEAGVVAGGGQSNAPFQYRIVVPGRYFIFVQFDPQLSASQLQATITVSMGDPAFAPQTNQSVRIVFANNFLSDPGLFDPRSGNISDQQFFESISGQIQDTIMQRLQSIFANTPITIVPESDPLPSSPFSTVTFFPDRILAVDLTLTDSALPSPTNPNLVECETLKECDIRVVFGEVLPRGANLDVGNQIHDDNAAVYVGSFQGRGECCQSAAISSFNNIVLGLSQTAAHEIGHLIGLYHVPLTDIMDRSPTQAFQRELIFDRGQLLIDSQTTSFGGTSEISTILLTTVMQDPTFYFLANFGG